MENPGFLAGEGVPDSGLKQLCNTESVLVGEGEGVHRAFAVGGGGVHRAFAESFLDMAGSRCILRAMFTGSEDIFVGLMLHLMTYHKNILLSNNISGHIIMNYSITKVHHNIGFHAQNRNWE